MNLDRKIEIERRVDDILEEENITKAPVPVEKIARILGATIRYSALDEELSGMIYAKEDKIIIGVNALQHPNRQRFTIAHEIGHLSLHKSAINNEIHVDKQFQVLMRDTKASLGTDQMEVEANFFASALLIPNSLLKQHLENHSFDIDDEDFISDIAKKFKVSVQAMQLKIGQFFGSY